MKLCFDTSVLVAALVQGHPHHALAFPRLKSVHDGVVTGAITTHGLAELFATLTALPLKPKIPPAEAKRLLKHTIGAHFEIIPLTAEIYSDALDLTVRQGLASGAIYDAIHLTGARSAGCDHLLTLNLKYFRALAPGDPLILSP
jgi:predicted nucleic acid-binding protein